MCAKVETREEQGGQKMAHFLYALISLNIDRFQTYVTL